MKRGVSLFILGLPAMLLAGRLAARFLFILRSGKPQREGGISLGPEAGGGNPCTLLMSLFTSDWVFLFKHVPFGGLDELGKVKEFLLA